MFGGGIAASGQLHPALGLRALSWRSNRGQDSTTHEFCKMVFVFCFFLMLTLTFSVLFQYNEMPRC